MFKFFRFPPMTFHDEKALSLQQSFNVAIPFPALIPKVLPANNFKKHPKFYQKSCNYLDESICLGFR